ERVELPGEVCDFRDPLRQPNRGIGEVAGGKGRIIYVNGGEGVGIRVLPVHRGRFHHAAGGPRWRGRLCNGPDVLAAQFQAAHMSCSPIFFLPVHVSAASSRASVIARSSTFHALNRSSCAATSGSPSSKPSSHAQPSSIF